LDSKEGLVSTAVTITASKCFIIPKLIINYSMQELDQKVQMTIQPILYKEIEDLQKLDQINILILINDCKCNVLAIIT